VYWHQADLTRQKAEKQGEPRNELRQPECLAEDVTVLYPLLEEMTIKKNTTDKTCNFIQPEA